MITNSNMLSFYVDHSVAPVRQNIADVNVHFARRRVLYQQLGIGAGAFSGRRVLEVGPGTGQNALFVAAQRPAQLVLVEPNPTGVEEIRVSFGPYPEWSGNLSVQNISIENYQDTQQYDFVLCEGLIGASGVDDPAKLIESIAGHVRANGVLVLTCIEYVAYLSEMLRRLLGVDIAGSIDEIDNKTALLLSAFTPHLKSLTGMSRRFDDWVIDNLINPASIGKLVSFEDCLNYLRNRFDILSTSPRFITDWTWYKKAAHVPDFFNKVALECYLSNLHNFMDHRDFSPPRSESANRSLSSHCEEIHHQIREYEMTRDSTVRRQIIASLSSLEHEILPDLPAVASALAEVVEWMAAPSIDIQAVAESKRFGTWFGRAATYFSLICKG